MQQTSKIKSANSGNGKWRAVWTGSKASIESQESGLTVLTRVFPGSVSYCAFAPLSDVMFAVVNGIDAGIFLFRLVNQAWCFVDELENIPNQNVINRRLSHVFLTETELAFVYNNRVRKYALESGALILNQAKRNARDGVYQGKEITGLFLKVGGGRQRIQPGI